MSNFSTTSTAGGFSSNSSRTILKSNTFGAKLTLSDKLITPTIYLTKNPLSSTTKYDVGMTCTAGSGSGNGTFKVESGSNEFSGTSVFNDTVTVNSKVKATNVFANYMHLGEKGSAAISEFAALGNETDDWGGTWIDFNRDSMTYKSYFINQRTENTVSSGETPGGFRFLLYDAYNEILAYPFDILENSVVSNVDFYCPTANINELVVGKNNTTPYANINMKVLSSTVPNYDVLIQSTMNATSSANGSGTLTIKSLKNVFDSYLEVPNIQISGTSNNTFYGKSAGTALTTGASNVFFGYESGKSITAGNYNVGIGRNAAQLLTTGTNNTIIGTQAGTCFNYWTYKYYCRE